MKGIPTAVRTRNHRLIAIVAVALVVVLAGCGGGGGGADTTTAMEETPTETPAGDDGQTPTAGDDGETDGPTPTDGDAETPDTPTDTPEEPGTDAGGDEGDLPADAGQQHVEALRDAGSFTVNTSTVYSNESGTLFVSDTESRIDLDAERGYQNGSLQLQESPSTFVTSTYTDGDTTYQRIQSLGQTQYAQESAPYQDVTPVNVSTVVGDVDENFSELDVRFERAGSDTVDGVSVTRYEANSDDLAALWNTSQYQDASVTDGEMTVAVDDDGIFRQYNISMTLETDDGEQISVSVEQRYTGIGDTTVEEPGWLDEAEAQSG